MDSKDQLYIIVIVILGTLSLIAGLSMILVFCTYCRKRRKQTNLCKVLSQPSQSSHSSQRPSHNVSISHAERDRGERSIAPVQLVDIIETRDRHTLWRGSYNGSSVCVKVFKQRDYDLWANERSLYTMSTTANDFILHYVGSEQRDSSSRVGMQLYTMTEYHPLGSLHHYLQHHILDWPQALKILQSVSSGLAYLHSSFGVNSHGATIAKLAIVHRDLKSANVLVKNDSGHCVLGGLDQALILNPTATERTLANLNRKRKIGTLQYMSPEALEGRMNLRDTESFKQIDVYALALVLWEVCTRCKASGVPVLEYKPPFSETVGETPSLEVMRRTVVGDKKRPVLNEAWNTHKSLKIIKEIMVESWDEDPEARLTAANIASRLQVLNLKPEMAGINIDLIEGHAEGFAINHCEIVVSMSDTSQNTDV